MGHHNIPSPPMEDHNHRSSSSRKRSSSGSKSKPTHRSSKRPSTHVIAAAQQSRSHSEAHSPTSDSRHKRVWKACERCRMKKTKCDGEFPCKRCKDDGLVCTAGVRKKTEYKQLPRGYAEVLESTQFTLISTIHKLYSMVRNGEQWELGEPMLNDRGQPIVHNIAAKLGCIRPNSDVDLPVHSVFPENEADLEDLVRQLREQEVEQGTVKARKRSASPTSFSSRKHNRASSSEPDHSDFEDGPHSSTTTGTSVASRSPGGIGLLSPQSLPPYKDFDMDQSASVFPDQNMQGYAWDRSSGMDFLDQASSYSSMDMLSQGLLESEFGSLKPHVVPYQNREVMLGMGDPMMYAGFDDETMRL